MVAPEETRSSRRPEADGADDRALLKPNDTEETPLEGGFPDAARPSGYRRITTLALCVAVTVSVVGLRRISTRPATAVASLSSLYEPTVKPSDAPTPYPSPRPSYHPSLPASSRDNF